MIEDWRPENGDWRQFKKEERLTIEDKQ